jgi:cytoskeletal protein CcmA (bactofilin family)
VQADIEAREIVIEGTVQGNLKAGESVRLGATSQVQGSLMTPRVAIDDGARLRGKVETTRAGELKRGAAAGQAKSAEVPPTTPVTATKE